MVFRSLVLSCSLLGFLAGGAVMAMEDDTQGPQNSIMLKKGEMLNNKEESRKDEKDESSLFNQLPMEDKATILELVAFDFGVEKKDLSKLALVCKYWNNIVNKENEQIKHRIKKVWLRGLYNIIDPKEVEIFEQFYNGVLIYRPDPPSDAGMIILSISALKNPLESTFDLSNCGDTGKYLSIATGYRKRMISSNSNVEMWFTPRFLVDREMPQMPQNHHIRAISGNWDAARAPIGIFWTLGQWNTAKHMAYCDYLTRDSMEALGSENLLKKYTRADHLGAGPVMGRASQKFHISFMN